MNKLVLKNASGLYFVTGAGFTATSINLATRLNEQEVACVKDCGAKFGFTSLTSEALPDKSYAIVYVRKNDMWSGTALVKASPSAAANQFDPSKRRFATFEEARIHGSRFHTRRALRSDPINSGTCGHRGFFIVETTDPVNSAVNPATGLTNRV